MGLLSSLFRKKKSTLSDADLGELESVTSHNDTILWQGRTQFLNENITFHIPGSATQLQPGENNCCSDFYKINPKPNVALKHRYDKPMMMQANFSLP